MTHKELVALMLLAGGTKSDFFANGRHSHRMGFYPLASLAVLWRTDAPKGYTVFYKSTTTVFHSPQCALEYITKVLYNDP